MRVNLLEGFGDWIGKQFNVDLGDYAKQGSIMLANVKLRPDGGGEPIHYRTLTYFDVLSNKDGTIFKLKDASSPDSQDPSKADFPGIPASANAGKTFTLPKKEYEKLLLFPKQPQQAPPMGM